MRTTRCHMEGECQLIQLPTMSEVDMLRERYTERWALDVCRSPTFVQSLKAFHIAPTITFDTPKGKSITISASDIYAARKSFLSMLESDQEACFLTLVGEKYVNLYQHWLLSQVPAAKAGACPYRGWNDSCLTTAHTKGYAVVARCFALILCAAFKSALS